MCAGNGELVGACKVGVRGSRIVGEGYACVGLTDSIGGSKKSYEGGVSGVIDPKGNWSSSKLTCREIMILLVDKSRHRYPWCKAG